MQVGVLGGSFNPVHRGHLFVAALARERAGLEEVLVVPAASPPHKTPNDLAPASDRLAMLREAVSLERGISVSEVELVPGGPRFTADTLETLALERPGAALSFILGMDSLADLGSWRDPERILGRFRVIAVDRPGFDASRVDLRWRDRALLVEGNPLAVSASGVRDRVARGLPIHHLVPDPVARYIEDHGLYRTPPRAPGP